MVELVIRFGYRVEHAFDLRAFVPLCYKEVLSLNHTVSCAVSYLFCKYSVTFFLDAVQQVVSLAFLRKSPL